MTDSTEIYHLKARVSQLRKQNELLRMVAGKSLELVMECTRKSPKLHEALKDFPEAASIVSAFSKQD